MHLWFDQYRNDMPPWITMYHFTPLTCCKDHKGSIRAKSKGGGRVVTFFIFYFLNEKFTHMVLIAVRQVHILLIETFLCRGPAGIFGMNLSIDHCSVLL